MARESKKQRKDLLVVRFSTFYRAQFGPDTYSFPRGKNIKYLSKLENQVERWLDRCLESPLGVNQNIFPIIQGGLDPEPRIKCSEEMTRRKAPGFAIGGLSGGETKDEFWRVIHNSAPLLPSDKPKYCVSR